MTVKYRMTCYSADNMALRVRHSHSDNFLQAIAEGVEDPPDDCAYVELTRLDGTIVWHGTRDEALKYLVS